MAYIDRMAGQSFIEKTREYLDYLEDHLENVRKAFIFISDACKDMMWVGDDALWYNLRRNVIFHDLSKFSVEEFVSYRSYFYPVNEDDKNENDIALAFEHHKKYNFYHWESVRTYSDVVHMVIDWTAMGYRFGDTAQDYYEKNKDRIELSKEFVDFMYEIFDHIAKVSS